MKRRKGPGVGNGVDNGRSVGNGVDRGRAGVVDDDGGMLVQASKQLEYYGICNGKGTIKKWASSNKAVMSDARDDTITTAVAVGISTPRNIVYNLITTL